jgi:hypothetical protein
MANASDSKPVKKEIYRTDVLIWERSGKPTGICKVCNKTVLRLGLDTCCDEHKEP